MGIWLGQQLDPKSPMYNAGEIVEIIGPFDIERFTAALLDTLAECEAINKIYVQNDGGVHQITHSMPCEITVTDVSGHTDPKVAAVESMKTLLALPADLTPGPIHEQRLYRLGTDRHLWYQQIHHIAADGYAFNLIAQRVVERYNNRDDAIKPLGSLAAVIDEDRAYQASTHRDIDRQFWLQTMERLDHPVSFTDDVTPIQDEAIHKHAVIPHRRLDTIKQLCQSRQISWPGSFMALVGYLLYRHRATTDVVLGIPIMGRMGSASLRVPTMVMNIIPLHLNFDGTRIFDALLLQVSKTLRNAMPHQRYRYEHLRRDLHAVGGDRRLFGPVVNVMPFDRALQFNDTRCQTETLSAGPVEDISFNFILGTDGELRLTLDANPSRYTSEQIEELRDETLHLIDHLALSPQAQLTVDIDRLSYLQGESLPIPLPSIEALLAQQVERRPDAVALIDGDMQFSYAQLHKDCLALAHTLSNTGVQEGDLIALALPRCSAAITASLACLQIGATYLFIDPTGPVARNRRILADAQPRLVVTEQLSAENWTAGAQSIAVDDLLEQAASSYRTAPNPILHTPSERSAAYVIYTSGSTGNPKGLAISRQALAEFVVAAQHTYGVDSDDRILQFAPLHFDASVEEIYLSLCSGACLCIRSDDMIDSVQHFVAQCEQQQITVLDLPTAYWHELVYYCANTGLVLPAQLRCVIIGGEAAQAERVEQWHTINIHNALLLNTYGPSEATVVATAAALRPRTKVSIGRPLPGRSIFILDTHGNLCPPGLPGELVLGGSGLANGYLNAETLTYQPFRMLHLPFLDAPHRVYHTGDRVQLDASGTIEYLGRIDDEIKISGHRINPLEVESALLGLSTIEQATVVAHQQTSGEKSLAAYVVAKASITLAQVRKALASQLPPAMLPTSLHVLDELPLNAAGKIDRRRLAESVSEVAPTDAIANAAPTNAIEQLIIEIWQQVLGQHDIDVTDDFFLLGGQSLQTIQVANRLTAALGSDISVTLLFEHPTVQQLSMALQAHGADQSPSIGQQVEHDSTLDAGTLATIGSETGQPFSDGLRTVLLTGANGFVGTQLLHHLLQQAGTHAICLLRADDRQQAEQKLRDALLEQGLAYAQYRDRIEIILGDLGTADLGLDDKQRHRLIHTVNEVWHNAAVTSVMRSYASLRATNVLATRALIAIAAPRRIPFHYVSTIAVGAMGLHANPVLPEDFVPWHDGLNDGYQQSKWASERLLQQAAAGGLPVAVYRLGRVSGHSRSGYFQRNDLAWRILLASLHHGCVPELDFAEPWTPVDQIAQTLVTLAQHPGAGGVFNCVPSQHLTLQQMFTWLREFGHPLSTVSTQQWLVKLRTSSDADHQALAAFFEQRAALPADGIVADIDSRKLQQSIAASPLSTLCVSQSLFNRYLEYAARRGWVKHNAVQPRTDLLQSEAIS